MAAASRVAPPVDEHFLTALMAGELDLKALKKKKKRARTADEEAAEGKFPQFRSGRARGERMRVRAGHECQGVGDTGRAWMM